MTSIEEAAEALRPFYEEAKSRCADDEAWTDASTVQCILRISDLRAALSAYTRLCAHDPL